MHTSENPNHKKHRAMPKTHNNLQITTEIDIVLLQINTNFFLETNKKTIKKY